jgi:hypothetical protein
MALFYLIAKKETKIYWNEIHEEVSKHKYEYLCLFPIPSSLGLSSNGIGITASGKFGKNIKEVKLELVQLLNILWKNDFTIKDLYKGSTIEINTYTTILNYL